MCSNDLRWTNRLLLAVLVALGVQIWLQLERNAEAETLRLDYCITERINESPQQYLHVVPHALKE